MDQESGAACRVDPPEAPEGQGSSGRGGPAEEFVDALTARDYHRLAACLAPRVRFRALVPPGIREREGPAGVVRLVQGWFEGAERIETLERVVRPIGPRVQVRYRLRAVYPDGAASVIEQDVFCDVEGPHVSAMDLVCSGFLRETSPPAQRGEVFDAGELGCGTGLPQEFRRRIEALPTGGRLEVHVRDPSAKEDLPSLARLLGHKVHSVRSAEGGSVVLVVERGR